jgi:hypothetical protein
MAKYINFNDLVEGAKCHVSARKIIWKGLRKDPITNQNMMLYELDRNCSVEVTESLHLEADALELRQRKNVHGNVGDQIGGDAIQLFIDSKRNNLKFEVKEGQSARHGANLSDTNVRTIGQIRYPYPNLLKKLGYTATSGIIEQHQD